MEKEYIKSVDYNLGRSDMDGNSKGEIIASRKATSEKWLDKLVEDVFGQDMKLPMTDDQIAGLHYALSTLPERDVNIVRLHYEKDMTMREIAEVYSISQSRVRQIILKIIHALRRKKSYILYGFEGCWTRLCERAEMSKTQLPNTVDESGIDSIPLSVRAYNCLARAKLNTIGQVCEAIETGQIYRIRNLGPKTLAEILDSIEAATGRSYRDMVCEAIEARRIRPTNSIGAKTLKEIRTGMVSHTVIPYKNTRTTD